MGSLKSGLMAALSHNEALGTELPAASIWSNSKGKQLLQWMNAIIFCSHQQVSEVTNICKEAGFSNFDQLVWIKQGVAAVREYFKSFKYPAKTKEKTNFFSNFILVFIAGARMTSNHESCVVAFKTPKQIREMDSYNFSEYERRYTAISFDIGGLKKKKGMILCDLFATSLVQFSLFVFFLF